MEGITSIQFTPHYTLEIQGKKLAIDGIPYTPQEFTSNFTDLLMGLGTPESMSLGYKYSQESKAELKKVAHKIFHTLMNDNKEEPIELDASFAPYIDYVTGETIILSIDGLNKAAPKSEDIITIQKPASFFQSLPSKADADKARYGLDKCRFTYEPYGEKVRYFEKVDGQDLLHINTYRKPDWMHIDPTIDPRPVELFTKLMEHLIPDKYQRDFTYVWIHRAIYDRNLTMLLLRGIRGNGKTILVQLIAALVGSKNSYKAQEDFFTTTFNSQLKRARFVYKDEGDIDKKANGRIKSYLNKMLATQEKFVNTVGDTEVFFSFALAHNLTERNYQMSDERKKSQPDLNRKDLKVAIKAPADRRYLSMELPDLPEDLAAIGLHLRDNYHPKDFPWTDTDPLKGEQYWIDVIDSQGPYYKSLIETVLSKAKATYTLSEISKGVEASAFTDKKPKPPRPETLNRFLHGCLWQEDLDPIASLEKDEDNNTWGLIPNENYMPEEEEDV